MKRFLYLLLLLPMIGCSPDSSKPIIPEDKMVEILIDQYIMQSAFTQKGAPSEEPPTYYFNHILEEHNYTEVEFDSALVWYANHLETYEKVYDKVMARLQAKEDSMVPIVAREVKGEDSKEDE